MTDRIPGGTLTPVDDLTLSRMGYGAMQLAGPGVFGPPRDRDQAIKVPRTWPSRSTRSPSWTPSVGNRR